MKKPGAVGSDTGPTPKHLGATTMIAQDDATPAVDERHPDVAKMAPAAALLTSVADLLREFWPAATAVDAYFADRDLDFDGEDMARALTEAANLLRQCAQ